MEQNNRSTPQEQSTEPKDKIIDFRKLWAFRKYLVVEPVYFFYVMASLCNSIAIQNFPLDKACRVNYGYNELICSTTLDKGEINCEDLNFENATLGATPDLINLTMSSLNFNYTVCKASSEAQKLETLVNAKRRPIAAIFSLIVLLFAGGWTDRYNKCKPCMIVPIVGDLLSFICLLISAIFFDIIPMEFGAYLEAIVPALFGGLTLSLMATYNYITIVTPEEDRIFRFSIFATFTTAVLFIGQPISGVLYEVLGYTLSFVVGIILQSIAILYTIFFVEEIKSENPKDEVDKTNTDASLSKSVSPSLTGTENLAYEMTQLDENHSNGNSSVESASQKQKPQIHEPPKSAKAVPPKISKWREIFDPTLAIDCIRLPFIKRENNGRMLLFLLLVAYFLSVGTAVGEGDLIYKYCLSKLNWNGIDFSTYLTVLSGLSLFGTSVGTFLLTKVAKLSDAIVGMLSTLLTVFSRIICAFARNRFAMYAAGVVDMLTILSVIAIKAIGSSIVDKEELGKMYSLLGISETIGQFIFPPLFSAVYTKTLDTFPGAFFLFSDIFYSVCVLVFILCYFLVRRSKRNSENNAIGSAQNAQNGNSTAGHESH